MKTTVREHTRVKPHGGVTHVRRHLREVDGSEAPDSPSNDLNFEDLEQEEKEKESEQSETDEKPGAEDRD